MLNEQFPLPEYPDIIFPDFSYYSVNQKFQDSKSTVKWGIRLLITVFFFSLILIVSFSYHFNEDSNSSIYFLLITFLVVSYILCLYFFTPLLLKSRYVNKKIILSRKNFFYHEYKKVPLRARRLVAKNIFDALKSDEWRLYINYANQIDHKRTLYNTKKIAEIASALCSKDPTVFSHAVYKSMHNKRGSVRYLFDMFIILTEQNLNMKNKKNKTTRKTKKLMMHEKFPKN